MDRWLAGALDYIPRWIEFQMQASQQPGCLIAIAHRDKIALDRAFGAHQYRRSRLRPLSDIPNKIRS